MGIIFGQVHYFAKYFSKKIPRSGRDKAIFVESFPLKQVKLPSMDVSREAYPDLVVYVL